MSPAAPVTLRGNGVRLEPLSLAHGNGLIAATQDGDIWKLHYTSAPEPTHDAAWAYIQSALNGTATGTMLPFAVIDERDGSIIGSTRLYDIDASVPTCAIGYTWYAARAQRTHINTACKRLLLGHAFDTLGMKTVYFHTSHQNLRSRAAIERLGATLDGVIRQHKRQKDGSLRDTCSYSILDSEWPAVRENLDARLQQTA